MGYQKGTLLVSTFWGTDQERRGFDLTKNPSGCIIITDFETMQMEGEGR